MEEIFKVVNSCPVTWNNPGINNVKSLDANYLHAVPGRKIRGILSEDYELTDLAKFLKVQ